MILACLFPLLFLCVAAVDITEMSPSSVEKDFGNMIDVHSTRVQIAAPSNDTLMLFAGPLYEPYDRIPPASAHLYCKDNQGLVVKDYSRTEGYVYSCCAPMSFTVFDCPIPPPPFPDIFRALPREDVYPVFVRTVAPGEEWAKTTQTLTYYDVNNIIGSIKRFVACIVLFALVLGSILSMMSAMNKWSNTCPRAFLLFHLTSTVLISIVETALLFYIPNETPHMAYVRAGLAHSLLNVTFSPFIIYVPGTLKGRDQRIKVEGSTMLGDAITWIKHPLFKNALLFWYTLSMCLQPMSIWALVEVMWETFDASFEIMIAIGIWYVVVLLVYTIAFVTGLYNIHVPLHLGGSVVCSEQPGQVAPVGIQTMGMYQPPTKLFVPAVLKENQLVAVETGGGEFSIHAWKLESILLRSGCEVRVVELPLSKNGCAVVYRVNERKKLERVGVVRRNHFHREHNLLLNVFKFILRIAPVFDESEGAYQLNTVEILREQVVLNMDCFGQPLYGIFYWLGFCATMATSIVFLVNELYQVGGSSVWWVYGFDLVLVLVLFLFAINVVTRKIDAPAGSTKRGAQKRTEQVRGDLAVVLQKACRLVSVQGILRNILQKGAPTGPHCPANHVLCCMPTPHQRFVCDDPECRAPSLPAYVQVWYCAQCNWCCCLSCTPEARFGPGGVNFDGDCTLTLEEM